MKSKVFLMLKKELREVFRDKKSLSMMLLTPFLIPFLIIGISLLFDSQVNSSLDDFNKMGFTYEFDFAEEDMAKYYNLDYKTGNEEEIKKLYDEKKIDLYIKKIDNTYEINYDENNEKSAQTVYLAEKFLESYKKYRQQKYLQEHNINSEEALEVINITYNTINKKEDNFYVNYTVGYAFLFVIMAITISATYPATDATAGEKERGTLETLLAFPIKSKDIILGKFLSVSTTSIITGLFGFLLSLVALFYSNKWFSIYEDLNILPSLPTILVTILIIVLYSFLISGLCVAIASKAKSFKEAQSALTPLTFICFFPGMISFMANIKTTNIIALIPFINHIQIFNDVNSGNINSLHILLMVASIIIFVSLVLAYIIREYKSEDILFRN